MRPWKELCDAYPRQELSSGTARKYYDRLQKFDVEILMAAVNVAIDRCKFFPTVAELIENIALQSRGNGAAYLDDEPRPSKEEAQRILEQLHQSIQDFESADMKVNEQRIAERKDLLRKQAKMGKCTDVS